MSTEPSTLVTREEDEDARMRHLYARLCTYRARDSHQGAYYTQGLSDYDIVCAKPFVSGVGVAIERRALLVATKCVYLRERESQPWREIGEFVITLYKDPDPAPFHCFNFGLKVDGFHHPHVNQNGIMCIGNKEEIAAAIADSDFPEALELIWAGLTTTNGTPYKRAELWPAFEGEPYL